MVDHIRGRDTMLRALREELVGPAPIGDELDCSRPIRFDDVAQSYGPYRQKGTGDEILQRDPPIKRYGVGVLYPPSTPSTETSGIAGRAGMGLTGVTAGDLDADASPGEDALQRELAGRLEALPDDAEADDLDLSSANAYLPSSMGLTFLAEFTDDSRLVIEASGGRYSACTVQVQGNTRQWWLRQAVSVTAEFPASALRAPSSTVATPALVNTTDLGKLDLRVEVFSRPYDGSSRRRLVTVCFVNRTPGGTYSNEACLFQASFRVRIVSPRSSHLILPYPGQASANPDDEEQSLALLYRDFETYAIGHGCAADWGPVGPNGRVNSLRAECLPAFEVPSVTPQVYRDDGTPLQVSMASLAGLLPANNGFAALAEVVNLYEAWIQRKQEELPSLDTGYRRAAVRHLEDCQRCVERMRDGIAYLRSDPTALRAFQLANHAILLQQLNGRRQPRLATYDAEAKRISFSEAYADPDPTTPLADRGFWRPFQVAFLLMALHSTAEGHVPDRHTVELIWFPTGGGKTEAYLGLSAFALFMRRLSDPDDSGVHVLMRYTLRLLTTQQFQRASGLACAMEHIRRQHRAELGPEPFSIGIWVGAQNTPNRRADAIAQLHALQKAQYGARNPFVLDRCPWCGAQMGVLAYKGRPPKYAPRVLGYEERGGTVVYSCPDNLCEFAGTLPVYVIDEDIYERRPSLVIGTVDKFAMLAWRPEARALFGIGEDGNRQCSPPGLIVQDELHLISGPLGSVVGLYEAAIEELCTDDRSERRIPPKIISSTATIRRYQAQIRDLYARQHVALFPPPGLEAGDSFFARYARHPDGTLDRGRIYVGVNAPGLGSMQTAQVRTFGALLQAPMCLPPGEARDPWWTLLAFFNSLRELGTTLSLFQSDIPDYLKVLRNRTGTARPDVRRPRELLELTGRMLSDEVPAAIAKLDVPCVTPARQQPQDVCLASSILEVGIDIDRLSLMAVVGQPKTTSQYIQVTGRVGRRWQERPGLVVTLYSPTRPRDRSHFEKFRSYHERLYAQVEPTSVTPFSPPALDRALHAVMVAFARQAGSSDLASSPYPYPEELMACLRRILVERVRVVDPAGLDHFQQIFDRRARQWRNWERSKWDASPADVEIPLLRVAGQYATAERARLSWPTPMSMRSVDAECEAAITSLYIDEGE